VLWGAEKKKRISRAGSTHFLELFSMLPIEVETTKALPLFDSRCIDLSRAYDISIYDASYLKLALRSGNPLAVVAG